MPIQSGDLGGGLGNANALADINPADILSIDVLKDAAAAALYGSRAANVWTVVLLQKSVLSGAKPVRCQVLTVLLSLLVVKLSL
jgi:TonB-dependent SusC/RagA subfamily outer membrane receptor